MTSHSIRFLLITTFVLSPFLLSTASAQEPQQTVRFVPNVVGQFNALSARPDAMGFHIGGGPDPSQCRHHQAIVRTESADGTPYFIISRSGPPRDFCGESIDPIHVGNPIANLYIVRMDSRNKDGERLRSNRLRRDIQTSLTPPEAEDIVVRSILYDGATPEWPHYDHPGGMQLVGNMLAVGVEFPARTFFGPPVNDWVQNDPNAPPVLVQFIDVADPENPVKKSTFIPTETDVRAGVVALTPCGANRIGIPCATGHYLLAITGGNNQTIHFYESTGNDLSSSTLGWTLLYTWHKEELLGGEWPGDAHQTLNFLREVDLNGALYLAGSRAEAFGDDNIDLYRVDLAGNQVRLTWVSTQHKVSHPAVEGESAGPELADFRAAGGFYVSPSGELLFYATEHDNDGPEGSNDRGSVKMGEWRHIHLVRPDSPTLAPSVQVGGPFIVDEGSSILLSGLGKPAITKAWVQLFEHPLFSHRSVIAEYGDRHNENFDNFAFLDPNFFGDVNGATDEASSWRWFAPAGCTLRVNQHSFNDSDFPGFTKTLVGSGVVEEASDLDSILADYATASINDEPSSLQFFANCNTYYNAPIGVVWDFDVNGLFETSGSNPLFSAADLDGPSIRSVFARAQHPTDQTSLGHSPGIPVPIQIRNVPPGIASFALLDSLGSSVGTDLPFALTNVGYAAEGSFTDPGKPDHQAATLNFGDGAIITSSAFDVFSDAFGGMTGRLRQRHSFTVPGSYTMRLTITDDDGGTTTKNSLITVVSPADAIGSIVNQIDLLLSASSNTKIIASLRDARENLDSRNSNNGALQKLASGDIVAALTKIRAAIKSLENAEAAGGGDLGQLKYLLGLAAESIAQTAFLNVAALLDSPSPGQTTQLERAQQAITDGHSHLIQANYAVAIDLFKDAVSRVLSLI